MLMYIFSGLTWNFCYLIKLDEPASDVILSENNAATGAMCEINTEVIIN